jgi:signal transduction histidine kinase
MTAVRDASTARAAWAFLRRTRHRVTGLLREDPLHEDVLAPVVEALALAEHALIERDPDLPLRRGRGPRPGTDSPPSAERALRERIAELEAAVRLREEHLAIVAHDLRGPISPVLLLVQRVREEMDGHPLRARIDAISVRLDQFVAKLHRLLDATRLQTDQLVLDAEPVDLAELAREVVAETIADLPASFVITVSADEPVVGRWDRLRLEEILRNLLSNAVRFGSAQPVQVAVRRGGDPELAILSVRDHGSGIALADQERIFEKHVRIGRGGDGFGLGLWIVRELTRAMGGMVEVRSAPGEGAEFRISLPRDPQR